MHVRARTRDSNPPGRTQAVAAYVAAAALLAAFALVSRAEAQSAALSAATEAAVKADVATRAGVNASAVTIVRAEAVTWANGCLGIEPVGIVCTLAIAPGFTVWAQAGTPATVYRYHTDLAGDVRLAASDIDATTVATAQLPGGATARVEGSGSAGFTGTAPAAGSIGLLVTSGASTAVELTAALDAAGCEVGTLAVIQGGSWSIFVAGAPAQVNAGFLASLDARTAFFVRCAPAGTTGGGIGDFTLFSASKADHGGTPVTQVDARIAAHAGFDRIVLEFQGSVVPGYTIEYITPPAFTCGQGAPVTLSGNASLQVTLPSTYVYDANTGSGLTIPTRELSPSLTTVLQAREICAFEAQAVWLFGLSERQPFSVSELSSPARLVIDVKH